MSAPDRRKNIKFRTERNVWLYLAGCWANARPAGRDADCPGWWVAHVIPSYSTSGLCAGIRDLIAEGWITDTIRERMAWRIWRRQQIWGRRNAFIWSHTQRAAAARRKFCLEQAELLAIASSTVSQRRRPR